MKVYRTEMMLCGTIYVKANDEAEALTKMRDFSNDVFYFVGENITDLRYRDPLLPEISLGQTFTGHGLCEDDVSEVELVAVLEQEDA